MRSFWRLIPCWTHITEAGGAGFAPGALGEAGPAGVSPGGVGELQGYNFHHVPEPQALEDRKFHGQDLRPMTRLGAHLFEFRV